MDIPKFDKLSLKFEEKADPKVLDILNKIGNALALIYKQIPKPTQFPSQINVRGNVEVSKPIKVDNLRELEKYFTSLEKTFNNLMLAVQSMPQPQIKLPKIEIPAQVKNDNPELMSLISRLYEKIDNLKPSEIKFPKRFDIGNFPPTMVPQPVTNININALQGFVKTTIATVGTTITQLPSYGQLFNRRSLIVYNNSANTIFIGGSDLTAGNGLPVPANSYSPSLDAGNTMVVYGIASQAGNNVRVLEISKDKSDTVQQ